MEEDCCCGKYTIVDKMPLQLNDYVHEPVDLEGGNFCGPRINHDIRDYKAEIERLKEENEKLEQYYDSFSDELDDKAVINGKLADLTDENKTLKQRIKELEEYVWHKRDCDYVTSYTGKCNCGYNELLNKEK